MVCGTTYLLQKIDGKVWLDWLLAKRRTMNLQEAFEQRWIMCWHGIVTSDAFLDVTYQNEEPDFGVSIIRKINRALVENPHMFKHANLFPNLPWYLSWLKYRESQQYFPDLTIDVILKQEHGWISEESHGLWDWEKLSCHPNITMENILDNQHLPWNWKLIAQNPNLTIDVLRNFPDNALIWEDISKCPNVTMQWLLKYPSKPWSWHTAVMNKGITLKDIEKHEQLGRYWQTVSYNPNITMEFVMKHLDESWDWQKLSRHPNITMDDINNHPNLPWDWKQIWENPNLTFEMIAKHLDKLQNIVDVLHNEFAIDRDIYIDGGFAILLISTIHEFYQQDEVRCGTRYTVVECVFFDEYLVKLVAKHFHPQTVF